MGSRISPVSTAVARVLLGFCSCVLALFLTAGQAAAQVGNIDLSLNLIYDDQGDPASAGTWEVVAKADQSGLRNLTFALLDISPDLNEVSFGLPAGKVNGSSVNNAGFDFNVRQAGFGSSVQITASQLPLIPENLAPGEELDIFYGVGNFTDGSPDFAGQPMDTMSIGPTFTTLADVTGVAWASTALTGGTGDFLGDTDWDAAVSVATGRFLPTQRPSFLPTFVEEGEPQNIIDLFGGSVWTSVGGSNTLGDQSSSTIITSIVRDNLNPIPDYNDDGLVNALDYALWRDTLGNMAPADIRADGDGNGVVDTADYDLWKASFGVVVPGLGSGSIVTVPEPSGLATAAVLLASIGLFHRKKQVFYASGHVFGKKREYRKKLLDTHGLASHNAAS